MSLRRILLLLGLCAVLVLAAATPWPRPSPRPAAALGVAAIAAGGSHSCAVTAAGGVRCWGNNGFGQLGDGTTAVRLTPVDVCAVGATAPCGTNLLTGVKAVAAGNVHTCALSNAGAVKCWGRNLEGQLGDGTTVLMRTTPVDVSGLGSGVAAITAGGGHTCAAITAGPVRCWGSNGSGQLGDGTTTSRATPVDVCRLFIFPPPPSPPICGALSGVAAVDAGGQHTCAVTGAGAALCWGDNTYGQLGDNSTTQRSMPVTVFGLSSGVASVAAGGAFTCARTAAGAVKCWGVNAQGQLGAFVLFSQCPGVPCQAYPVDAAGLTSGVAAIGGGSSHTCAVMTAGGLKCWGSDASGQLGDGTLGDPACNCRSFPVDVAGFDSAAAVAGGFSHTCSLRAGGDVLCWGSNDVGQLGDGTRTDRRTPFLRTVGLSGLAALTAGGRHTCALTAAGGVKCWGDNATGQLGTTTAQTCFTPGEILPCSTAPLDVCATGATPPCTPASGNILTGVAAVVAAIGAYTCDGPPNLGLVECAHTCAVTTAGTAKCWGSNEQGELGNGPGGSGEFSAVPVDVCAIGIAAPVLGACSKANNNILTGVAAVALGSRHTCALMTAGGVTCWGSNEVGQLGDGIGGGIGLGRFWPEAVCVDFDPIPARCAVPLAGAVAIDAGSAHTCVVLQSGYVQCWGVNGAGQLGDGTTFNRSLPVFQAQPPDVVAVAAGGAHTCALVTTGAVRCWGRNDSGQLGTVTTENCGFPMFPRFCSTTPVDVCATGTQPPCDAATGNILTGIEAIDAGGAHTCAATGGFLRCWGNNTFGQLGGASTGTCGSPPDTFACSTTPVLVANLGGVASVAAGEGHTCALLFSGRARCWGRNESGQLGTTTTEQCGTSPDTFPCSTTPVEVAPDTDRDGCTDGQETQTAAGSERTGGRRNPKYFWDFFDVPSSNPPAWDKIISVGDIAAVVARFGSFGNAALDPLSAPPAAPAYHPAFDRTLTPGGDPWDTGPPDGSVGAQDIFLSVRQFGHSCAA